MLFTTKPQTVIRMIEQHHLRDAFGLIGRYGLPGLSDLLWISALVRTLPLGFIGDLDPVDLMIFRWLQLKQDSATFHYQGITDKLLSSSNIGTALGRVTAQSPSEQAARPLLSQTFPDLEKTVGQQCFRLLEQGQKLELAAMGTARLTSSAALQDFLSQR